MQPHHSWHQPPPAPPPPSQPRPRSPKSTSPPSTRLQPIFPDTRESITAHTSPSASAQSSIWTPCSLRRFPPSRFRPWECPPTSSATSERRQNNSTLSSYGLGERLKWRNIAITLTDGGVAVILPTRPSFGCPRQPKGT